MGCSRQDSIATYYLLTGLDYLVEFHGPEHLNPSIPVIDEQVQVGSGGWETGFGLH
jgi:hypothetical protein